MNYPTPEEIRAAHDAINADGPMAETTIRLSAIVLNDPVLRGIVNRWTHHAADRGHNIPGAAALASAIATGLNYGLRIHEQRMADLVKPAEKAGGAS